MAIRLAFLRMPRKGRIGTRAQDQSAINPATSENGGVAGVLEMLRAKEEAEDFDVFLCHNSDDKPAIWWIYERLKGRAVLPWFDAVDLRPGFPWQAELGRQIDRIKTAAVFVGPNGIGPWQDKEIEAFLGEFVRRECPVIPVLLPGVTTPPKLPVFLSGHTWVDLRNWDEAGIDRLLYGITGRKPRQPDHGTTPGPSRASQ